jgi:hypothetical protein
LYGSVLDKSVASCRRDNNLQLETVVSKVKAAIMHMRQEYRSGECPTFSFEDYYYRLAYLYEYASANSLAVDNALSYVANKEGILDDLLDPGGKISICCLGGGPGSEIVGVAKRVVRQQRGITRLEVVVTDKYPQWAPQWKTVLDALNNHFSPSSASSANRSPFVVSRGFVKADVEDPGFARVAALRRGFDLYIASYVVSHIFNNEGLSRFRKFLGSVIDSAPKGSKFLFVDRGEVDWEESVTELLNHPKIEISGPFRSSRISPGDTSEEKSDLGVLYQHLGIDPRLRWNIFWVVGTKV